MAKMRELLESTVVLSEATNQACIKPEIDQKLLELNDQIVTIKTSVDALAESLRSENNVDAIKVDTDPETGFCFRVTLKVWSECFV